MGTRASTAIVDKGEGANFAPARTMSGTGPRRARPTRHDLARADRPKCLLRPKGDDGAEIRAEKGGRHLRGVGEAKTTDGHWCIVVFYVGPGRNTPQELFAFRAEDFDAAQRAALEMVLPFGAARGTGEFHEAHGLLQDSHWPPAQWARATPQKNLTT